ncbi:spermidine synthase [Bacillus wudalianchiensis]|uniref:Polyamine aminopropyltransferase n=2 Tax=Pseudobacillus wudalianchiensis TaxID=1743143 RepID=A0A1B9AY84_9BACI|nr:polyamine aminopropyltransferase [Bacillus wudalianchiensis]OCA88907.1 spermidine synthase [Bacillus wudalianchiensis]
MVMKEEKVDQYIKKIDGELWLVEDDRENLKVSYRVKEIIFVEQSPFQHVMVLDTYDFGRMLVLDGVVQSTEKDGYIYNEMIAHVPLHIHPHPKKVLIIGGGDCGAAREIIKYPTVEELYFCEIDELVVKASKEHLKGVSAGLEDDRVHYLFADGIQYMKEHTNEFDVIIVDSSDPVGPATQLFEFDFYKNVFEALKEDGLMVCQSESPIFYKETMQNTYESLNKLFPNVRQYTAVVPTYPGGLWSFTLASKKYEAFIQPNYEETTKYFNKAILQASFALPQFMLEDKK